jgi:NADPH-dependent 7-cyano-7-deazaguanine reductase QueF-like protein
LLPLITSDEDSIRRVDNDNLDGTQHRLVVGASFDFRPSYSSLDQDSRLMDRDACKLKSKKLSFKKRDFWNVHDFKL